MHIEPVTLAGIYAVTSCSRQSQLRHVAKCVWQDTSIGRVRVRVSVSVTVRPIAHNSPVASERNQHCGGEATARPKAEALSPKS